MLKAKPIVIATMTVVALGVLSACGGSSTGGMSGMGNDSPTTSSSASGDFNNADVTFAQDMIPHHQQALEMVALTEGRTLSPEVQKLADAIRNAQTPEITKMTEWLKSWGKDVPTSGSSMGGMDMGTMPGMMSDDDMKSLKDASDADFQKMWLEMMIQHHEGAIAMAKTEASDGMSSDAKALASSISSSQQDEIDQMQGILTS